MHLHSRHWRAIVVFSCGVIAVAVVIHGVWQQFPIGNQAPGEPTLGAQVAPAPPAPPANVPACGDGQWNPNTEECENGVSACPGEQDCNQRCRCVSRIYYCVNRYTANEYPYASVWTGGGTSGGGKPICTNALEICDRNIPSADGTSNCTARSTGKIRSPFNASDINPQRFLKIGNKLPNTDDGFQSLRECRRTCKIEMLSYLSHTYHPAWVLNLRARYPVGLYVILHQFTGFTKFVLWPALTKDL